MKTLSNFTGLYSVSKTLRFELKPIGKTLDNIEKNGVIGQDNKRAESYKEVKKIIDSYHKDFIERILSNCVLRYNSEGKLNSLQDFYLLYHLSSKDEKRKNDLPKVQAALRKQIAESFTKSEDYKFLFAKELIREKLPAFVKELEQKNMIAEFNDFTTYFTGFHENRKNMYVADEKSTAIAYRLINENLPKFVDNMAIFEKIALTDVANSFETIYKDFEEYLNVTNLSELFALENYTNVLSQTQIDVYNLIIGGKSVSDKQKIKGLNEYINLYNQQNPTAKLPKLKQLYKQILSDRESISWLPEAFESDNQMLESIGMCYANIKENVLSQLKSLLQNIARYDLSHIYIKNDLQLTEISQKAFGKWDVVQKAIELDLQNSVPQKSKESAETYETRISDMYKKLDSFSLAEINRAINTCAVEGSVESYFGKLGAEETETRQKENLFVQIENAFVDVMDLLNQPYPEEKNLSQDKKNVEKLKNLLDALKSLQLFVKPLLGSGLESDKDAQFYGEFTPLYEMLDSITSLYNMVRNRMTSKPYSEEKIKLNFENKGNFLGGWVDSKTENSDNGTQYGGYLLRRKNSIDEYDYYLGVSSNTKLLRESKQTNVCTSSYERLNYYQLKSQTIYGSSYVGDYDKDSSLIKSSIEKLVKEKGSDRLNGLLQKDKNAKNPKTSTAKGFFGFIKDNDKELFAEMIKSAEFLTANDNLISNIKKTLTSLKRVKEANSLVEKKYLLFTEIMDDVDLLTKKKIFSYFPVDQEEIETAMHSDNGALYLFKITNKDLSYAEEFSKGKRKSRGIDNLHTMYFKALMEGNQNVFDIGTGSIFFRKKSLNYSDDVLKHGHHREQLKDKFNYPIISKKRYAFDKFQFHLSIVQNYTCPKTLNINPLVNEYLKQNKSPFVIGIDRGERHLLYLSLIDSNGNIVEQYSLNKIINEYNGRSYETDYHSLLDTKEKNREEARKSWQTIETIKELKEGYLSQVIHKIAQLMVKYNAIVVLEYLNKGLMRGRQNIRGKLNHTICH